VSQKKIEITTDENTLVLVVNYERQTVELINGEGKALHVEGTIDKQDGVMKIDLHIDTKQE